MLRIFLLIPKVALSFVVFGIALSFLYVLLLSPNVLLEIARRRS